MEIFIKLIDILTLTHNNILMNIWSSKEAEAVLRTYCINKETINKIIDHAYNTKMIISIKEEVNFENNIDYIPILVDEKKEPQKYQMYQIPCVWNEKIPINTYVEAPMHLLFLGISKTIFTDVVNWLISKNKLTAFCSYATGKLEMVELLELPWLKTMAYPRGKFGGRTTTSIVVVVVSSVNFVIITY